MPDKRKNEKITIDEYRKLKELRDKRRFKFDFYPWPVMVALLIPLGTFIFLLLAYIFHLQGISK